MVGSNPFDFWRLNLDLTELGLEASGIVAMRTLGMMGLWRMHESEMFEMVAEKPAAFAEAWTEGLWAAMRGAAPEAVVAASIRPIGRKTKSNHKRLSRAGFDLT